jgi:hypothetical protein
MSSENRNNESVLRMIEKYTLNKLSPADVDELWETFIEKPHLYHLFETELHLRSIKDQPDKRS